jgi:hypothetical protein
MSAPPSPFEMLGQWESKKGGFYVTVYSPFLQRVIAEKDGKAYVVTANAFLEAIAKGKIWRDR